MAEDVPADQQPEMPMVDSGDLFRVFYEDDGIPDIEQKVGEVSPRPDTEDGDPDGV